MDDDENSLVLVLGIIGAAAALPVLSWPRITEAMCRWFETRSLREIGEKVCFGSPTKHFVIFDLAGMFRVDVKETPILRKFYVKYTSKKHQFDAETT